MPDTLVTTSLAGATAAIAEATLTYPLEYLKTRQQLVPRDIAAPKSLIIHNLSRVMFTGCSAVVTGNATKAFLRYSTYNWASKFMADLNGQTSGPQAAVAAMFTGMCESLVVVPFESIKTVMVERSSMSVGNKYPQSVPKWAVETAENIDKQRSMAAAAAQATVSTTKSGKQVIRPPPTAASSAAQTTILHQLDPKVHGLVGNVREMYSQRGLRAFVQGFSPTLVRQIANAMVRFTTFNFLKQMVWSSSEPMPGLTAVALGMAAGAVEVAATQPIDVVKTRMQASNGLRLYGNSVRCSYQIFMNEGPAALWAGVVPRFLRVSFSSGIMFGVYEITNTLLARAMKESPFGEE